MRYCAAIIACGALFLTLPAAAQDAFLVEYTGELIDDTARPLAGVFSLDFKLFAEDDEDPVWESTRFIAVSEGEYTVRLGTEVPLDRDWEGEELAVAVYFGGGELTRATQAMTAVVVESEPEPEAVPVRPTIEVAGGGSVTEVTFAQLADRALVAEEAEHAGDAESIQGHTWDDIDERIDDVVERLAEHQADPEGHGRVRVGLGSQTVLQRVGGEGGVRYTRMCPAGYVVVGIRGGAGGFVDSMELVCAQLE